MNPRNLFVELKRCNLYKVAVAYAVFEERSPRLIALQNAPRATFHSSDIGQ